MHALSRPVLSRARPLLLAAAMGSSSGRDPSGHPAVGRLRELFRGGGDAAGEDFRLIPRFIGCCFQSLLGRWGSWEDE
jgi:hypothetical protein